MCRDFIQFRKKPLKEGFPDTVFSGYTEYLKHEVLREIYEGVLIGGDHVSMSIVDNDTHTILGITDSVHYHAYRPFLYSVLSEKLTLGKSFFFRGEQIFEKGNPVVVRLYIGTGQMMRVYQGLLFIDSWMFAGDNWHAQSARMEVHDTREYRFER